MTTSYVIRQKMSFSQRRRANTERRNTLVFGWHLSGFPHERIAAHFGVNEETVRLTEMYRYRINQVWDLVSKPVSIPARCREDREIPKAA